MDRNTLVNIGEQRYDRLIEQDKFYIDKTSFIKEWWETGSTVTLITRPRRFGKTLNMSMLECFFSIRYAGRSDLFEGLSIWSDGFVLGLMVELSGQYEITSNRESGQNELCSFGRYDVMLKPMDREKDCAYIIEFKVYKSYKEKTLMDTLANAHAQIEEKQYEAGLIAEGFAPGQIRKYGFAFQGKKCLIG